MGKQFKAYLVLALLFVWHLISRFILKLKPRGIEAFKKDYSEEYLFEVSPETYEKMQDFHQCINCYLCDAYCSNLSIFHRDGLPKISEMILSNSTSLVEYRFSQAELDIFDSCDTCSSPCVSICPNEYPIFELIQSMKNYNEHLEKQTIFNEENHD